MSGWDSRIKIRIDTLEAFKDSVPEPRVGRGEVVAALDGGAVELRGGIADSTFSASPALMYGEQGFVPLTVDDGSAESGGDGGLVWWDGDAWQTGATPIEFSAGLPSGAVTYTAATDTWATDTSLIVPTSLDGGTFSVNVVAPSFSAGYSPQIGEA